MWPIKQPTKLAFRPLVLRSCVLEMKGYVPLPPPFSGAFQHTKNEFRDCSSGVLGGGILVTRSIFRWPSLSLDLA